MNADERGYETKTETVSLVFPMYNEAGNLGELRRRVCAALDALAGLRFEIILVDDHSSDGTRAAVLEWARADNRVRYLRLSRNFGSHAAIAAGLHEARGDCVVVLAADLQDPPELLETMLERRRAGFRVVWAVRESRDDVGWRTRWASNLFWCFMRFGVREATPTTASDYFLMDRAVIDAYQMVMSRNESLIATICWLGFAQCCVPYRKAARASGKSGWSFGKKWKLFIDSIVGFSYWPIRAMSVVGIVFAMLGFVFLGYLIWHRLSGRTTVQGWAGLMAAVLSGFGVLMIMVGVLGEYVWRVLDETRGRPKYVVEERRGVSLKQPELDRDNRVSSPDDVPREPVKAHDANGIFGA